MSTFSSLFAIERDYGVRVFMNNDQLHKIDPFFNSTVIHSNMKSLENYFPEWASYNWVNLFRYVDDVKKLFLCVNLINKKFFRDKSLNDSMTWKKNAKGTLIDVGQYPNAIFTYYKYMNELRQIFKVNQRFILQAKSILKALKSNSKCPVFGKYIILSTTFQLRNFF